VLASGGLLRGDWLERFIRMSQESAEWLQATTPGQYLKEYPPAERLYVPSLSSMDMMGWALSPDVRGKYLEARKKSLEEADSSRFLVGGHFRQFLTRYPEAWLMYAKMMYTHVIVNQVRGDRYKKKAAQNELWKGQCHHAYWHGGATGGIYENALRKAVYRSLIEAEKITRATEIFAPSIISADYDMDNMVEYLYQGSELNAYIHARGAALVELDFLPSSWNYLDTMEERGGSPTPGHRRRAFLDHFFEDDCSIDGFTAGRIRETGDFLAEPYELVDLNRALPELLMRRSGSVLRDGVPCPVTIEKRFVFRPRSIDVYYRVTQPGPSVLRVPFGVELNVSLAGRSPDYGRLFLLDEGRKREIESDAVEISGVQGLLVRDVRNEVSITLSSALPFRCWSLPVQTSPFSAGSGEPSFQSHCFVPLWQLELAPGEGWENHMSVGFEKTQEGRI
ncbi:MAG TPA: alpha-amylase/4-alpha-glucanotransferase domain-containing protein, partial [Spirochaetia bacterium]|nr:alpha-amylase/4-alpha-glucanotransferase domain-containing protein [Spirochaetia bacterium]